MCLSSSRLKLNVNMSKQHFNRIIWFRSTFEVAELVNDVVLRSIDERSVVIHIIKVHRQQMQPLKPLASRTKCFFWHVLNQSLRGSHRIIICFVAQLFLHFALLFDRGRLTVQQICRSVFKSNPIGHSSVMRVELAVMAQRSHQTDRRGTDWKCSRIMIHSC